MKEIEEIMKILNTKGRFKTPEEVNEFFKEKLYEVYELGKKENEHYREQYSDLLADDDLRFINLIQKTPTKDKERESEEYDKGREDFKKDLIKSFQSL